MKVWPFSGALLLALAACCPAPLAEQPTAFRGVVVGVSAEVSTLHLERTPGTPLLTFVVPENGLHAGTGETLPLTALRAGDAVYVQGVLRDGELHAAEVRRLE